MKNDVQIQITEMVIAEIEKNNILPWDSNILIQKLNPRNHITQKEYSGVNRLLLSFLGNSLSQEYATYNQINKAGGKVTEKGGLPIVFYSPWDKVLKTNDISKSKKEDIIWFLKKYIVFFGTF